MITKVVNVNLHQPIYERLTAKQGDIASRYLLFHLLDGDKPFDLTGKSVRVYARKPDKTVIFNDLIINDETKGYCTLELTSQCLASAGIVKMELYISESGKVLTSIPFELEVIPCINTVNSVTSTNEFSALNAALGSLQDYDNLKREIVEARKTYGSVGKRLNNINEQLDNNTKEITVNRNRKYNVIRRKNLNKTMDKYIYPVGFDFNNTDLIDIRTDGYNYFTNFTVDSLKHIGGKTVYLSSKKGSSAFDGLSEATPCQNMVKALSIATDGDTIYIIDDENTTFDRSSWVPSGQIDKSVNIISKNKIIVFKGNNPTWVKTDGYTNIYECAHKFVIDIVDLNNKIPLKYIKVNNLELVDVTPFSWYTDGSYVYVNCGHISANSLVLPLMESGYPCLTNANTSNLKIYLENIDFVGGDENVRILGDETYFLHELYAKKCRFLYATKYDSVEIWDCKLGVFEDCECGYSAKDGFNYSAPHSRCNPDFIEINCKGYGNGDNSKNSPDSHNGSTAHVNCRGIRINSTYNDNVGGNVVESGTAKTVNLGCVAYDSKSVASNSSQGFGLQTSTGEMWMENCIAFGNKNDMFCADGSVIHIKKCEYDTKLGGGNWDCDERL